MPFSLSVPHLNEYSIGRYIGRYIVAGATRTLFLTDPAQQPGTGDPNGPWLGHKTILAEESLCVNTIQLYPDDENGANKLSLLEIADLTLDPRFQTRDYVLNNPCMRFYAGTPRSEEQRLNSSHT